MGDEVQQNKNATSDEKNKSSLNCQKHKSNEIIVQSLKRRKRPNNRKQFRHQDITLYKLGPSLEKNKKAVINKLFQKTIANEEVKPPNKNNEETNKNSPITPVSNQEKVESKSHKKSRKKHEIDNQLYISSLYIDDNPDSQVPKVILMPVSSIEPPEPYERTGPVIELKQEVDNDPLSDEEGALQINLEEVDTETTTKKNHLEPPVSKEDISNSTNNPEMLSETNNHEIGRHNLPLKVLERRKSIAEPLRALPTFCAIRRENIAEESKSDKTIDEAIKKTENYLLSSDVTEESDKESRSESVSEVSKTPEALQEPPKPHNLDRHENITVTNKIQPQEAKASPEDNLQTKNCKSSRKRRENDQATSSSRELEMLLKMPNSQAINLPNRVGENFVAETPRENKFRSPKNWENVRNEIVDVPPLPTPLATNYHRPEWNKLNFVQNDNVDKINRAPQMEGFNCSTRECLRCNDESERLPQIHHLVPNYKNYDYAFPKSTVEPRLPNVANVQSFEKQEENRIRNEFQNYHLPNRSPFRQNNPNGAQFNVGNRNLEELYPNIYNNYQGSPLYNLNKNLKETRKRKNFEPQESAKRRKPSDAPNANYPGFYNPNFPYYPPVETQNLNILPNLISSNDSYPRAPILPQQYFNQQNNPRRFINEDPYATLKAVPNNFLLKNKNAPDPKIFSHPPHNSDPNIHPRFWNQNRLGDKFPIEEITVTKITEENLNGSHCKSQVVEQPSVVIFKTTPPMVATNLSTESRDKAKVASDVIIKSPGVKSPPLFQQMLPSWKNGCFQNKNVEDYSQPPIMPELIKGGVTNEIQFVSPSLFAQLPVEGFRGKNMETLDKNKNEATLDGNVFKNHYSSGGNEINSTQTQESSFTNSIIKPSNFKPTLYRGKNLLSPRQQPFNNSSIFGNNPPTFGQNFKSPQRSASKDDYFSDYELELQSEAILNLNINDGIKTLTAQHSNPNKRIHSITNNNLYSRPNLNTNGNHFAYNPATIQDLTYKNKSSTKDSLNNMFVNSKISCDEIKSPRLAYCSPTYNNGGWSNFSSPTSSQKSNQSPQRANHLVINETNASPPKINKESTPTLQTLLCGLEETRLDESPPKPMIISNNVWRDPNKTKNQPLAMPNLSPVLTVKDLSTNSRNAWTSSNSSPFSSRQMPNLSPVNILKNDFAFCSKPTPSTCSAFDKTISPPNIFPNPPPTNSINVFKDHLMMNKETTDFVPNSSNFRKACLSPLNNNAISPSNGANFAILKHQIQNVSPQHTNQDMPTFAQSKMGERTGSSLNERCELKPACTIEPHTFLNDYSRNREMIASTGINLCLVKEKCDPNTQNSLNEDSSSSNAIKEFSTREKYDPKILKRKMSSGISPSGDFSSSGIKSIPLERNKYDSNSPTSSNDINLSSVMENDRSNILNSNESAFNKFASGFETVDEVTVPILKENQITPDKNLGLNSNNNLKYDQNSDIKIKSKPLHLKSNRGAGFPPPPSNSEFRLISLTPIEEAQKSTSPTGMKSKSEKSKPLYLNANGGGGGRFSPPSYNSEFRLTNLTQTEEVKKSSSATVTKPMSEKPNPIYLNTKSSGGGRGFSPPPSNFEFRQISLTPTEEAKKSASPTETKSKSEKSKPLYLNTIGGERAGGGGFSPPPSHSEFRLINLTPTEETKKSTSPTVTKPKSEKPKPLYLNANRCGGEFSPPSSNSEFRITNLTPTDETKKSTSPTVSKPKSEKQKPLYLNANRCGGEGRFSPPLSNSEFRLVNLTPTEEAQKSPSPTITKPKPQSLYPNANRGGVEGGGFSFPPSNSEFRLINLAPTEETKKSTSPIVSKPKSEKSKPLYLNANRCGGGGSSPPLSNSECKQISLTATEETKKSTSLTGTNPKSERSKPLYLNTNGGGRGGGVGFSSPLSNSEFSIVNMAPTEETKKSTSPTGTNPKSERSKPLYLNTNGGGRGGGVGFSPPLSNSEFCLVNMAPTEETKKSTSPTVTKPKSEQPKPYSLNAIRGGGGFSPPLYNSEFRQISLAPTEEIKKSTSPTVSKPKSEKPKPHSLNAIRCGGEGGFSPPPEETKKSTSPTGTKPKSEKPKPNHQNANRDKGGRGEFSHSPFTSEFRQISLTPAEETKKSPSPTVAKSKSEKAKPVYLNAIRSEGGGGFSPPLSNSEFTIIDLTSTEETEKSISPTEMKLKSEKSKPLYQNANKGGEGEFSPPPSNCEFRLINSTQTEETKKSTSLTGTNPKLEKSKPLHLNANECKRRDSSVQPSNSEFSLKNVTPTNLEEKSILPTGPEQKSEKSNSNPTKVIPPSSKLALGSGNLKDDQKHTSQNDVIHDVELKSPVQEDLNLSKNEVQTTKSYNLRNNSKPFLMDNYLFSKNDLVLEKLWKRSKTSISNSRGKKEGNLKKKSTTSKLNKPRGQTATSSPNNSPPSSNSEATNLGTNGETKKTFSTGIKLKPNSSPKKNRLLLPKPSTFSLNIFNVEQVPNVKVMPAPVNPNKKCVENPAPDAELKTFPLQEDLSKNGQSVTSAQSLKERSYNLRKNGKPSLMKDFKRSKEVALEKLSKQSSPKRTSVGVKKLPPKLNSTPPTDGAESDHEKSYSESSTPEKTTLPSDEANLDKSKVTIDNDPKIQKHVLRVYLHQLKITPKDKTDENAKLDVASTKVEPPSCQSKKRSLPNLNPIDKKSSPSLSVSKIPNSSDSKRQKLDDESSPSVVAEEKKFKSDIETVLPQNKESITPNVKNDRLPQESSAVGTNVTKEEKLPPTSSSSDGLKGGSSCGNGNELALNLTVKKNVGEGCILEDMALGVNRSNNLGVLKTAENRVQMSELVKSMEQCNENDFYECEVVEERFDESQDEILDLSLPSSRRKKENYSYEEEILPNYISKDGCVIRPTVAEGRINGGFFQNSFQKFIETNSTKLKINNMLCINKMCSISIKEGLVSQFPLNRSLFRIMLSRVYEKDSENHQDDNFSKKENLIFRLSHRHITITRKNLIDRINKNKCIYVFYLPNLIIERKKKDNIFPNVEIHCEEGIMPLSVVKSSTLRALNCMAKNLGDLNFENLSTDKKPNLALINGSWKFREIKEKVTKRRLFIFRLLNNNDEKEDLNVAKNCNEFNGNLMKNRTADHFSDILQSFITATYTFRYERYVRFLSTHIYESAQVEETSSTSNAKDNTEAAKNSELKNKVGMVAEEEPICDVVEAPKTCKSEINLKSPKNEEFPKKTALVNDDVLKSPSNKNPASSPHISKLPNVPINSKEAPSTNRLEKKPAKREASQELDKLTSTSSLVSDVSLNSAFNVPTQTYVSSGVTETPQLIPKELNVTEQPKASLTNIKNKSVIIHQNIVLPSNQKRTRAPNKKKQMSCLNERQSYNVNYMCQNQNFAPHAESSNLEQTLTTNPPQHISYSQMQQAKNLQMEMENNRQFQQKAQLLSAEKLFLSKLNSNDVLSPQQYCEELFNLVSSNCPMDFYNFYSFITKRQVLLNENPISFRAFLRLQNEGKLNYVAAQYRNYYDKHENDRFRYKQRK